MDKNKKILAVGGITLLAVGIVMAVSATETFGMQWARGGFFKHGSVLGNSSPRHGGMLGNCSRNAGKIPILEELGLPANASRSQLMDALWEKRLKDLGLTDGSTLREYRQALEAKMQADREDRVQKIREKVGLPENTTQEYVRNAMKQWREENKEMLLLKGSKPRFGGGLRKAGCGKET